ncbi:hypothetical protein SLEP1_g29603 [Rubroshorea leprosula]|uniref:RRM domain-containing protein n=1 Tax=Rubroshorea leprosula TaxID=152421 RepID=A0AAV5K6L1_9ROSI|nr:hypothetical protein SLEP1_g29603 [Rubroshorea leprosula]
MRERNHPLKTRPWPVDFRPPATGYQNLERHPVRERTFNHNQPNQSRPRDILREPKRTVGEPHRGQRGASFGYGKGVLEQATSFFFTNFPDDWRMDEMWTAFIRCGRAIQVYVARKKDKRGRRFGFVRFLNVNNPKELEAKLKQIHFDNYHLEANIAIFSKDESKPNKGEKPRTMRWDARRTSRTYADVLKGVHPSRRTIHTPKPRKEWRIRSVKRTEGEEWHGLEFQVEKDDLSWLEGCFVGRTKGPEIIGTLQERFLMEGYFSAKVTPMGGNLVLISGEDSEELKHLVEEGRDWLSQWFTDVRPWSPTEVATERFTWLRCQGVPLQIWKSCFFQSIACLFGKFVSIDGSTIKKSRLDVAKILILTPIQENIHRKISVKVGNDIFQIRISEEVGIDNIFCLRSDFALCKEESSNEDDWTESAFDDTEDENVAWDGLFLQDIEDDEDDNPKIEEHFPATSAMEEAQPMMVSGKEAERWTESVERVSDSINAVEQNLNNAAPIKTIAENVGNNPPERDSRLSEARLENGTLMKEACFQKTEASNTTCGSEELQYPPGFGPPTGLAQNKVAGPNEEKGNKNRRLYTQTMLSKQISRGSKSEGETNLLRVEMANTKRPANGGNPEDGESSTQPFWEGLASEDEILQLRAERLAQKGKKKRKQVKRKKSRTDGLDMQRIREVSLVPTVETSKKRSCLEEAEELWVIGQQLGLIDESNSEEIIRRLEEMERRDRAALAKQKMTGAIAEGDPIFHP